MHAHKLIATDTIHAIPASLLGELSYLMLGLTGLQMVGIFLILSIPAVLLKGVLVAKLHSKITHIILVAVLILVSLKPLIDNPCLSLAAQSYGAFSPNELNHL